MTDSFKKAIQRKILQKVVSANEGSNICGVEINESEVEVFEELRDQGYIADCTPWRRIYIVNVITETGLDLLQQLEGKSE